MKRKALAYCRIALLSGLIAVLFTAAWAEETAPPSEKLVSIFPKAANFVEKKAELAPDQVAFIEEEIGTKLRPEDVTPTFYIAVNEDTKQIGLALLVAVHGPNGIINGGVGARYDGKGGQS